MNSNFNKYLIFSAMGLELGGLIIGCLLLGQILDEAWGTKGLAMLALSILGLVGWFIQLLYLLKRMEKVDSE